MKLIFMGTPDLTVPVLETLKGSHEIVGIYTNPPRENGRNLHVLKTPVHQWGEKNHIPVFTPLTLKDEQVQTQMANLKAEAIIVYAYSQMIPENVLNMTEMGCINIHPSLLPRWRGAAPIIRAIEAGDKETGVSIMKLDKGWDTGPIFDQKKIPLNGTETPEDLGQKLTSMACLMLLNVLKYQPQPVPQATEGITYAKKFDKTTEAELDLKQPAAILERKIRAFGKCYLPIGGKRLIIKKAEVVDQASSMGEKMDRFNCADGKALRPLQLNYEGKKSISLHDFLLGNTLTRD